jgi:hypothetical protein
MITIEQAKDISNPRVQPARYSGAATVAEIVAPKEGRCLVILNYGGQRFGGVGNTAVGIIAHGELPSSQLVAGTLDALTGVPIRRLLLAPNEKFSMFGGPHGEAVGVGYSGTAGFCAGSDKWPLVLPPGHGLYHEWPVTGVGEEWVTQYLLADAPEYLYNLLVYGG